MQPNFQSRVNAARELMVAAFADPKETPAQAAPVIEKFIEDRVRSVEGNLLDQKVDAIVNAWNRNLIPQWLLVTQGVSAAIKKAGGKGAFRELRSFGTIPWGGARLTSAGTLPFKGIIHVAGINHAWRSSEWSIAECVRNALQIAKNERFQSVAFPAIGSGSCIRLLGKTIPIWGVATERSLEIIQEEAKRSDYSGEVIVVKFRR